MQQIRYTVTQARASNRYLGTTVEMSVWDKRRSRWDWRSLWNFDLMNSMALYHDVPPPGHDRIQLIGLTPKGRYQEPLSEIKLKHWGVK